MAGLCEGFVVFVPTQEPARAKVGDERVSFGDENISRLDIAMQHTRCVRVCESVSDLTAKPNCFTDWQWMSLPKTILQRCSFDERHHVVRAAGCGARVE